MARADAFYNAIRRAYLHDPRVVRDLLARVDHDRVIALAGNLERYLASSLPVTIRKKKGLADYRLNPYVAMTTSSTMRLTEPRELANFLINLKLYMGLETSFGKSIEKIVMERYPIPVEDAALRWADPEEKRREEEGLKNMSNEEKARKRTDSVWREIDRSCVRGDRRYLVSIKSGPATINDTQVQAMYDSITRNHGTWLEQSVKLYGKQISGIDIVIGLTYGTERTTNNKENQILIKLQQSGFSELDRAKHPGVLVAQDGRVRVYRHVGVRYWSFVADPAAPDANPQTFLEVLLSLAKALKAQATQKDVTEALNDRLDMLAAAILKLKLPRDGLPDWMAEEFSAEELVWIATAISAYFDAGDQAPSEDELPLS